MPHTRQRYLAVSVRKAMSAFPLIGLLGQRQVGKTTLASLLGKEYTTLDIRNNLELCEKDPELFLKNRRYPFVIDEAQLSAALFPALKEAVRQMPRPGQFIITGSVRFSSRKQIRESLTGRIALFELLPLNITEAHEESLNPLLPMTRGKLVVSKQIIEKLCTQRDEKIWQRRIDNFPPIGGLPGVCFSRDRAIQGQKFESYLETILLRDLQLILQTTLAYPTLKNFVTQIALKQGEEIDYSDISRQTGISTITIKRLLNALQGLYLIREIPGMGPIKKSCYYLEDAGIASHLMAGWQNSRQGLFRLLHANLRPQFFSRFEPGMATQVFHYKTRGGAHLPFVFKTSWGDIAYHAVLERTATASALLSAKSFLKNRPKSIVFIAHQGDEIRLWDDRIWSVPLRTIL